MGDRRVKLPKLHRKGNAYYFVTTTKPRRWIALGTDLPAAIRRYHKLIASPQPQGTIGRLLTEHLATLTVRPRSMELYRVWARHLGAVFGHMALDELTPADVLEYLDRCPRTSGPGEVSLLSGAYRTAMRRQLVTWNPCVGAKTGKPRAKRMRYLTDAEFERVRAKASPVLQVAIDLAYLTALRISDLVAVRWDAFAPGGYIEAGKTGARARFDLTPELAQVLDAARALQTASKTLTVLSERGRPLTASRVRYLWRQACAAAGVTDARWHDLRAKAATDVDAEAGDAQRLLQHTTEQQTRTYLRGRRIVQIAPAKLKRSG
jgi:integrase